MSKKLAFASILLLSLGVLIIPTGIVADKFLDDTVSANLATGLKGIRDESLPIVEEYVNATLASILIGYSIGFSDNETFFNENESTGKIDIFGYFNFTCLSYFYGENLSFTSEAQILLLFGKSSRGNSGYLPGIISEFYQNPDDPDTAWGLLDFLEDYTIAMDDPDKSLTMQINYNCTWDQLSKLCDYILDYIYLYAIPELLKAGLHTDVKPELSVVDNTTLAIGWFLFLQQWANGTLVSDPGFAMPLGFMDLYGFELGIPESSNMSWESVSKLWNETWEYSMLNERGMERWKIARDNPSSTIASYLQSVNELTDEQMSMVLVWIGHFEHELMPYLGQYLYHLPIDLTSLSDLLSLGGIFIGTIFVILSTIIMFINKVKKHPKEKVSITKEVSNHIFLSGLNGKKFEPENDYNQSNDDYYDEEVNDYHE